VQFSIIGLGLGFDLVSGCW